MYTPPPAAPPAQNAPPAPSSAAKGPSRSGALKDPLGDRMKEYEGMEAWRTRFTGWAWTGPRTS